MKKLSTNIPLLVALAVSLVSISVYVDYGSTNWVWFQRSGSIVTLVGALLSYRSIMRLGTQGVGGANTTFFKATLKEVDDSGPVQKVSYSLDHETAKYLRQANVDRIAGYIGAIFVLLGTGIWGYGDLLGRVL